MTLNLEQDYFKQAQKSFLDGNHSACLVYLKKVELTTRESVALLVDCIYDLWITKSYNKDTDIVTVTVSSGNNDDKSHESNDNENDNNSVVIVDDDKSYDFSHIENVNDDNCIDILVPYDNNNNNNGHSYSNNENGSVIDTVYEYFSLLLDEELSSLIIPYDFIRLSHIYIGEGLLNNAIVILNIASERGFMEDTLIVTQYWTLLKHLNMFSDSNSYMNYLTTSIVTEYEQRLHNNNKEVLFVQNTSIQLSYIYLHVASHLAKSATINNRTNGQKSPKKSKTSLNNNERFQIILTEAYDLYMQKLPETFEIALNWFREPSLWYEIAEILVKTPFVLLAEESYWECYKRNPLDEKSLRKVVYLMEKMNRNKEIIPFITRAYHVKPWNLYCRELLLRNEEKKNSNTDDNGNSKSAYKTMKSTLSNTIGTKTGFDNNENFDDNSKYPWRELFKEQNRQIAKVQCLMRGAMNRIKWKEMRQVLMGLRGSFQAKVFMADFMYKRKLQTFISETFEDWRDYIEERKVYRKRCATKIQSLYRRHCCIYYYQLERYRMMQANMKYITICQQQYDFKRLRLLRKWEEIYLFSKRTRAADMLSKVMKVYGYSLVVTTATELFLSIIRIKRKYNRKRILLYWHERLEKRRLLHAKITIRFFIRDQMKRHEEKLKNEELKKLEYQLELQSIKFERNNLPLYQKIWKVWREEYTKSMIHKKKIKLTKLLTIFFNRMKARQHYKGLTLRYECQATYILRKKHEKKAKIFTPWKINASASKIQRCLRSCIAKMKLHRLQRIDEAVKVRIHHYNIIIKQKIIFLWNKYCYLYKREKLRASKIIVLLFRRIVGRSYLTKHLLRKIHIVDFVFLLDRSDKKCNYRNWKYGISTTKNSTILTTFFDTVVTNVKRINFNKFYFQIKQQSLLKQLINKLIIHKSEKKYWIGCNYSVKLLKHSDYVHLLAVLDENDVTNVYEDRFKPWERHVPEKKILYDEEKFSMLKAFKSWMVRYKFKNRCRRGSSRNFAGLFITELVRKVMDRGKSTIIVQSFIRKCLAQRKFYETLLPCYRRNNEAFYRIEINQKMKKMVEIFSIVLLRQESRLILQCAIRQALARRKVLLRRSYQKNISEAVASVSTSMIQRYLLKLYMEKFQVLFCISVCRRGCTRNYKSVANTPRSTTTKITSNPAKKKRKSKNLKTKAEEIDSGSSSEEEFELESTALHQWTRQNLKTSKSLDSGPHKITGGKREEVSKHVIQKDFQSENFHKHLFRLRQSGVFMFEYVNTSSGVVGLSKGELRYLLQHAGTVFCQQVSTIAIRTISKRFIGNKVILCSGVITDADVNTHIYRLITLPREAPLSLHITGINMRFNTALSLCFRIQVASSMVTAIVKDAELNKQLVIDSYYLSELAIDSDSFGSLAIAVLLMSLKVRLP